VVEGFGAAAGLEQRRFGEDGDRLQAGGAAGALAGVGDGLVDLPACFEHTGAPDEVRPDRARVQGQQLEQFIVSAGLEQGAVAGVVPEKKA
jgi:hypothetical protein